MSDFGKGDFGRGAFGVTPMSDGARVSVALSAETVPHRLVAGGERASAAVAITSMTATFSILASRYGAAASAGAVFGALVAGAAYRTDAVSATNSSAQRVTIGRQIGAALSAGAKFAMRIVGVERSGAALSARPVSHGHLIAGASRPAAAVSHSTADTLVAFILGVVSHAASALSVFVQYVRGGAVLSDSKATFVVAGSPIRQSRVIGTTESTAKFFAALRVAGATNEASQSASLFTGRLVWEPDIAEADNWAAGPTNSASWQTGTTSQGGWNPSSLNERPWAPCEGTPAPWLTPTPHTTT